MRLKSHLNYKLYVDALPFNKYELIFCVGCMLLALLICLYSIPKGALSAGDSIEYLVLGERFSELLPQNLEGPLFPLMINIGVVFGLTSVQTAAIIPIICFSLLWFPLFILGKTISRPITAYVSSIFILLYGNLLYISQYMLTDMLYFFIAIIAIMFLAIYNKYGTKGSIILAAIFVLFAEFTRSIGVTLFLAGIIVIASGIKRDEIKRSIILLLDYCLIAGVPFILLQLFTSGMTKYIKLSSSKNPQIDIILLKFYVIIEQIFYRNHNAIIMAVIIICLIMIYIISKHKLVSFIKETIPITSYVLIYLLLLIIVTSSLWIGVEGGVFDIRKVTQIMPYIILTLIALIVYTYSVLSNEKFKSAFKTTFIIISIFLVIHGSQSLYSSASDIRSKALSEYSDRDLLESYILTNNITIFDTIYIDKNILYPKYTIKLHMMKPDYIWYRVYFRNSIPGKTIFDGITLLRGPNITTLAELIANNKYSPTYIITSKRAGKAYFKNQSKDIFMSDPCEFSDAIIFKASLLKRETKIYIPDKNEFKQISLAGNFMTLENAGQNYDQLLIASFDQSKSNLQLIDFLKEKSLINSIELFSDLPDVLLSGDFASLGHDQILYIDKRYADNIAYIEDFSHGWNPSTIRLSEMPSNDLVFKGLIGIGDAQIAGDFLALGCSQVLFMDRDSKEKRLVLADFSKNKSAQFKEIPLTGDSARIARWLDKGDLQYAGDFMGLGSSQVLFVNRNHTKDEKEKLIIMDFSDENRLPSIEYQENWGESGSLGGWLDANDTQLIGDFMNLGHSQVLFINHGKSGGKLAIRDFSHGKPPSVAKFSNSWNSSDLFESWLSLNDTMVAGDFKDLGYSQVLFINSSIDGTNATIVDFSNKKPLIRI